MFGVYDRGSDGTSCTQFTSTDSAVFSPLRQFPEAGHHRKGEQESSAVDDKPLDAKAYHRHFHSVYCNCSSLAEERLAILTKSKLIHR